MDKAARRVEFGWIAPLGDSEESKHVPILRAEEKEILPAAAEHFDSLWVFDHLLGFGDPDAPYLESWTALTWLAAHYPGVQVGHLVMAMSFRPPPLVAKMGATLAYLSGGRFVLGVGAGWREEEYRAYGYDYPAASTRIGQLDEAVQIIKSMWTEPSTTFNGKYFRVENAHCAPRPSSRPPVMIGGAGEKLMLPLIARQADWWSVYPLKIEDYARKWDLLKKHLAEVGRQPSDITQAFSIYNAKLPASAEESTAWLERLRPLVDLGVSHFMIDFGSLTSPETVQRFAEDVIEPINEGK